MSRFYSAIFITLAVVTIVAAAMQLTAHAEDPVPVIPKKLKDVPLDLPGKERNTVLSFVRKGGFAGFNDNLRVYDDNTFAKFDRPRRVLGAT